MVYERLKEKLRVENSIFQDLERQHQEYEKQLIELNDMPFLTTDLQVKQKEIKKLKLRTKDKMEKILQEQMKCEKQRN
jgi:uncharacterized protein YdcH (DUF465 family)